MSLLLLPSATSGKGYKLPKLAVCILLPLGVFFILFPILSKPFEPFSDYNSLIGLTENEARERYPDLAELDELEPGFSNLVSKNLSRIPHTHQLLRFGWSYLVAEIKDGRVIAIHRVSG